MFRFSHKKFSLFFSSSLTQIIWCIFHVSIYLYTLIECSIIYPLVYIENYPKKIARLFRSNAPGLLNFTLRHFCDIEENEEENWEEICSRRSGATLLTYVDIFCCCCFVLLRKRKMFLVFFVVVVYFSP